MAQFVRAGLRYRRWLETEGLNPPEFPSDVVTDLRTAGDKLSVYEVSPGVSAERIAVALAGTGKLKPEETSYAVFESGELAVLGINAQKCKGATVDPEVNNYHYDLEVGAVARLLGLAGVMAKVNIVPILKKTVEELLKAGVDEGRLDRDKMNKSLKEKLQRNA